LKAWVRQKAPCPARRFEVLWKHLVAIGLVEDVLIRGRDRDVLLEEAENQLGFVKAWREADRRTGKRRVEISTKPFLSKYDEDCASAVGVYLAYLADRDWDVKTLRDRLFAGKPLKSKQAASLLNSQAARVMTLEAFQKRNIPLYGHETSIEWLPSMEKGASEEIAFFRVHISMNGGRGTSFGYRREETRRSSHAKRPELAVPIKWFDGKTIVCGWLPVWPHSVLDEIRVVSTALVARYGFRPHEATWFLVTGARPLIDPLVALSHYSSTCPRVGPTAEGSDPSIQRANLEITLTTWTSERAIISAVRAFQRKATGRKDRRKVSARSVSVLQFVATALRQAPGEPDWKQLYRSWEKTTRSAPGPHFRNSSDFKRAFERAVKSLILLQPVNKT